MNTKTTFHDLYDDVLLCIFQYFDVHELYGVFSEVIPYLTSLLINSRLRLHLRKRIFIEIDPTQILSVDLPSLPRLSSLFLADCVNLRSLILRDMEDPLILVEQPLPQSLEMLYLNISLRNNPTIIPLLMELLTRLSKLKSYTLIYSSSYFVLEKDGLILPERSSTVQNVNLEMKCSIGCLEKLFGQLLSLRRVQALVVSNPETSTTSLQNVLFPSIENLSLTWEYIPFQDMIIFCQKMPNLKQCNFISTDYQYDQDVISPRVWRRFIEVDHLSLQKLVINMQPRPGYRTGGIPRISLNNSYFLSINFKFQQNHWKQLGLEGHYIRSL